MPYALEFEVPGNEALYERVKARSATSTLRGCVVHMVVKTSSGLRHIEVWDSVDEHERFHRDRVEPAVHAVLQSIGVSDLPHPRSRRARPDRPAGCVMNDTLGPAPTHAMLATFHMDLSREAEQQEGLNRMIVPSVRSSPGFVSGCWTLDRATSESVAMITFDSIEAAQASCRRCSSEYVSAVGRGHRVAIDPCC